MKEQSRSDAHGKYKIVDRSATWKLVKASSALGTAEPYAAQRLREECTHRHSQSGGVCAKVSELRSKRESRETSQM